MALTRLDNLYSSKTGRYLYVSPDDFNATDELDNRGNSPLRPFKTIQRAFIEVSRYSYLPGRNNDRFDQFSIMLMPGNHYIDNRPGEVDLEDIPEFNYNQGLEEWNDSSIVDLSNPDNVLYKFNASTGGAIVPRGCSLIGYDLRRTIVRPLYVPDPADGTQARTSIFNLTGGCYLWQFTIKDGDLSANSPLFDSEANVGKVYFQKGNVEQLAIPEYSHHKICIMEYADNAELNAYYQKIGKSFSRFQPTIDDSGEFEALVQENRIVGPLSDTRRLDSIQIFDSVPPGKLTVRVTTKIDHGYFVDQYVAILNTGLNEAINGTVKVTSIDTENPRVFEYEVAATTAALGLVSGQIYTNSNGLNTNAVSQAEIDSVESASPYVFNCSIRSTWGMCGMWADGAKATGFKSMVVAQYTGVSLQKDDRAFIRYDRFTNTWNQASLTDAFATVPYHTKGDAYWKDDWRNFHIRASDDAFIQCVSVFAVGFFDHFLMESGGDMSITNSNSNFGNTSLHAIGFKGFSFNQDKGGYITDIIPPQIINTASSNESKVQYYTLDIQASNAQSNNTRLYLGADEANNPTKRPAATVNGYRIGARNQEKIYVKLDTGTCYSVIEPNSFVRYKASLETLNPAGIQLDNVAQDAANRIEDNKALIQNEAYNYIVEKFPALLTNTNITISKCERDIGYFVDAVIQDLRLGGNVNTVQAAEGYYVGNSLVYITEELDETIEALTYVKEMAIAAMRNFDFLIQNCQTNIGSSIVDVGDTSGLLIGMSVSEYNPSDLTDGKPNNGASPITTNIPAGTYIKRIIDSSTIELGVFGSNLSEGLTVNALQNSTTAFLYFNYLSPAWSAISPTKDNTLIQDTNYPECANTASIISGYFSDIFVILNDGPGSVNKIEPDLDLFNLSRRATVFTIDTGLGTSNPHQFETGTPVRLVPKAKEGTNPDKRVIRLPRGFSPNTKYYVIAPGRSTLPEDYSGTSIFDGSDQTKLMLAATKENAAAGIYIYSPETDSVDPDVEIEIQQYVLDINYDLHQYRCNLDGSGEIKTNVAHIFDLPAPGVTPQRIFFRVAEDIQGSDLPEIEGFGTIDTQTYYYARFVDTKSFSVHQTYADAIAGVNSITFTPNSGQDFYVFADKRVSPLRFDAEFSNDENNEGLWYLQVRDESSGLTPRADSILTRFHDANAYGPGSGKVRTLDTWYNRIQDNRGKQDRVYRLRYVIPKYLETVRDPLNGFVLKVRTDDKRRLVPQKFVLKPIGGAPTVARFDNPEQAGEIIGYTLDELEDFGIDTPSYDPYLVPKIIDSDSTQSKISFSIQSARKITQSGNEYLEITAFDHQITNEALKNEIFSVVEIDFPQGGTFTANNTSAAPANYVTWSGYSEGNGYIQGYFEDNGRYFLVLKNITGELKYNAIVATTFTQNSTFADLIAKPNSVGDPNGKDKSDRKDYLYRVDGANVYTLVPGDVITDDANNQYTVENVRDVGNLEDTFYIFDINEIQERIAGQQDGIYYLTCVRGNVSPFPTGAGVGTNFRNFKFSQPISQLYPQNYKNDPVWFKQIDSVYNDPPASVAAADNYVHGLVTINDSKNSETKEVVLDLVGQPALENYNFVKSEDLLTPTLQPKGGSVIIEAQDGDATSGSENRYIPISGDSEYPTERRLYVELRRPSIARSGNHTFEYLGFGPGNYSTGFPLRQEVILSDTQDFYAQSKRENGGIVFYTGLNSNGDLYIGNRKINAITGEETFLESAELVESSDEGEDDLGGNLVTTFDTPVTFNDKITVEGDAFFNNPVEINVGPNEGTALRIYSVVDASLGDDITLSRSQFVRANDGDITLSKNRIDAAVYGITPRQLLGLSGQPYSIRTHFVNGIGPTNITPDQDRTFSTLQEISYSSILKPRSGDVLLKGDQVGLSGSLGWVFANDYVEIVEDNIQTISSNGIELTIQWAPGVTNDDLDVKVGSQIRIRGFSSNTNLNGIWTVLQSGFSASGNTCKIQVAIPPASGLVYVWSTVSGATMEVGKTNWKEFGVLGSETLRTNTATFGDYKLGINTIARASNTAYLRGFVDGAGENNIAPRANLDLVGNAFISGKTISISVAGGVQTKTETNLNNAFLVGGDSLTPNNTSVLRISTTNGGRVGINTTNDQLNGSADSGIYNVDFAVIGDTAISNTLRVGGTTLLVGNTTISADLAVNGGDITTTVTSGTFNLLNDLTFTGTLNVSNSASTLNLANAASLINIGINASTQVVNIGNPSSSINNTSRITIGGAYNNNESNSFLEVKTKSTKLWGDLQIGSNKLITDTVSVTTAAGTVNFFSNTGAASTLNFATNASEIKIGGQGGTTTVQNSLTVDATALVKGNLVMNGGTASFSFNGTRSQLGSTISTHTGTIATPLDKNVDLITILSGFNNVVDTAGAGSWGGTFFQQAIPTYTQDSGLPLAALTGNQYYLPLLNVPTYAEGDDILIDSMVSGSVHPEIVKVATGGLVRVQTAPYYIIVQRQPYGTFLPIKTNHPDATTTRKVNVALDATWLTANVDGSGTTDQFDLAEFGGLLSVGDYLFVSRNSSGTSGEAIKLGTTIGSFSKKFIIRNGVGVTKFEVDSLNGATIISDSTSLGGLTVWGPSVLNGAITTTGTLTLNGGDFVINDSLGTTNKLTLTNSTGDLYIAGDLTVNGNDIKSSTATALTLSGADVEVKGDLTVTGNDIKSSGGTTVLTLNNNDATFADNLIVTGDLDVNGGDFTVRSAGTERFAVNNTGAIDLGGIDEYFTSTGGRKWIFIQNDSNVQSSINDTSEENLRSNCNYFVQTSGSQNTQLILMLPGISPINTGNGIIPAVKNGDMIRIVDTGGKISNTCQLILRARNGIKIQGDATGTNIGMATGTYSGGGEIIINTPNAGFGLIYCGSDSGAPSTYQGWWLVEI